MCFCLNLHIQRLLDLNAFLIFMILAQRVEFHTEFMDKFNWISLNQSLYFFFFARLLNYFLLRLYLTLQLKFFDGIMLIFNTATTITILLFLIFLDLLSLKKITKKKSFCKKKKKLFEFFVFIITKAFNYLLRLIFTISITLFSI